jgi:hypothetical protein
MFEHHDKIIRRHRDDFQSLEGLDIGKRLRGLCHQIAEFLDFVDHPIVYVVLNKTSWDGGRRFAAWLNGKAIALPQRSPVSQEKPHDTEVVILPLHAQHEQMERFWIDGWADYHQTTSQLESKHHLTTWNQLLLNHSYAPQNLGLVWAGKHDLNSITPYFPITLEDLASLGLPSPHAPEPPEGEVFLALTCPGEKCPLHDLEQQVAKLKPDSRSIYRGTGCGSPWHALVACLTYHLLRSYACWGGAAFLSIPIAHRSMDPGGVSVLSLCSTRPLNDKEIEDWDHLGSKLFHPLRGDGTYAELCARARLDEVSPNHIRSLTRCQFGEGSETLDDALWPQVKGRGDSHADDLFREESNLTLLYKLPVVVPGIGQMSLCALLLTEFELKPVDSLQKLAVKAKAFPDTVGRIREQLQGNVDVQARILWERAGICLQVFKQDLERSAEQSDGTKEEASMGPIFAPLMQGGTGHENLIFRSRERLAEDAFRHRCYVSPSAIDSYLNLVFRGMGAHLEDCKIESNRIAFAALVHLDRSQSASPLLWLLVCNSVRQERGASGRQGGTGGDLQRCARKLESPYCFDGCVLVGDNLQWVAAPRDHLSGGACDAGLADRLLKLLIAAFRDRSWLAPTPSRIFVNLLALPVFDAESKNAPACPDH